MMLRNATECPIRPRPVPGKYLSLVLTALIHVMLAAFLFFSVRWQTKPQAVAVELVSSLPPPPAMAVNPGPENTDPPPPQRQPEHEPKVEPKPTPKPVVKPEPPKPAPTPKAPDPVRPDIAVKKDEKKTPPKKEEPKKEEKKPEPPKKPDPKPEPKKPEPPKEPPKKVEPPKPDTKALEKAAAEKAAAEKAAAEKAEKIAAERARQALLKAEQDAINNRMQSLLNKDSDRSRQDALLKQGGQRVAQAQANASNKKALDEYAAKIRAKVRGNIVLPPRVQGNPEAVFLVDQLPDGTVIEVKLKRSSGNPALDQAIERAINKSSPLPKPSRAQDFARTLELKFKPLED